MARPFRSSDEGKEVVSSDGDRIGRIERVEGDEAHVKPETGLAESIRNRLGMGDDDEEMYVLDHSEVATIGDDEVHLQR
jgi:sporulation protein YlmC with PRC-barrel domain